MFEDYEQYGAMVQQALWELPKEFRGYPVSWIQGRNGVLEINSFYRKYLATDGVPTTIGQWLNIPAHHLATATNGEVFADPLVPSVGNCSWDILRISVKRG